MQKGKKQNKKSKTKTKQKKKKQTKQSSLKRVNNLIKPTIRNNIICIHENLLLVTIILVFIKTYC